MKVDFGIFKKKKSFQSFNLLSGLYVRIYIMLYV